MYRILTVSSSNGWRASYCLQSDHGQKPVLLLLWDWMGSTMVYAIWDYDICYQPHAMLVRNMYMSSHLLVLMNIFISVMTRLRVRVPSQQSYITHGRGCIGIDLHFQYLHACQYTIHGIGRNPLAMPIASPTVWPRKTHPRVNRQMGVPPPNPLLCPSLGVCLCVCACARSTRRATAAIPPDPPHESARAHALTLIFPPCPLCVHGRALSPRSPCHSAR